MSRPPQDIEKLREEYREAYDPELREQNRLKRAREAEQEGWRQEDLRRQAVLQAEHEERMRERRARLTRPWTDEDLRRQAAAIEGCRIAYRDAGEKRAALATWAAETEEWLTAQLAAMPVLLADHRAAVDTTNKASEAIDVTRSRGSAQAARAAVLRDHAIDPAGGEPLWPSHQLQSPDLPVLLGAALRLLTALREGWWTESRDWRETMVRL